ncbi:hypothetical protein [Limnohabitans sp. Jir72]|uniref:hypothetical protein n=1 Tax=Limnohabitans sp. Jir72 TaxID=1977909 RepID=UPI0011B29676|nr:hypothetical protein [Limnohabitans sp. Jir72]
MNANTFLDRNGLQHRGFTYPAVSKLHSLKIFVLRPVKQANVHASHLHGDQIQVSERVVMAAL